MCVSCQEGRVSLAKITVSAGHQHPTLVDVNLVALFVARSFARRLPISGTSLSLRLPGPLPTTGCRSDGHSGPSARLWAASSWEYATAVRPPTVGVMDIRPIASQAIKQIAVDDSPFDLPSAVFFVVSPSGELITLGTHDDLYTGLQVLRENIDAFLALVPRNTLDDARMIGVVSCGWAAPLADSDQMPPSENPARKRCRIAAVVDTQLHFAAAVQFESDPDDVIVDDSISDFGICLELRMTMEALVAHRCDTAIKLLDAGQELDF